MKKLAVEQFAQVLFRAQQEVREGGGSPRIEWKDITPGRKEAYCKRAAHVLACYDVTPIDRDILE